MPKQNFIRNTISSLLVQTFLIYMSGGWIVLEMTDYFIRKYELNEKISDTISIILLIGLPIAIFFAWYLSRKLNDIEESASTQKRRKNRKSTSINSRKIIFSSILINLGLVPRSSASYK